MKKTSQHNRILKIQMILVLLLGITIGTTLAYFTSYVAETGKKEIVLGPTTTEIKEEIKDLDKSIKIFNQGPSEAFVRVKVFYPQFEDNRLIVEITANEGWNLEEDGWYVYEKPLKANETTATDIYVNVTVQEDYDHDFNIIVVHESVQPSYDGNRPYPNWNMGLTEQGKED